MAQTQGPTVTAVAIAFGVLTFITISLRLWARIFVVKSLGADDYLIFIAALLSWAFIGATIASVQWGLGSHIADVEATLGAAALLTYGEIVWLSSIFYNATLGFIKTSVLALYMRLGDRRLRRLAILMTAVIFCQAGANVLVCIFECTPVSAAWGATEAVTCIDVNAFYLGNAAVNIFTDLLTYTLPIPLALRIQLPLQQRIGLGVILSLGLLACVSSIIRISYIPQMLVSTDSTWAISGAMYWSVIETNIGILAASIPSWKVLAKKYMPRLLGTSEGHSYGRQKSLGGVGGGVGGAFELSSRSNNKTHTPAPLNTQKKSCDDYDAAGLRFEDGAVSPFAAHVGSGGMRGTRLDDGVSSDEEALFTPEGRIGVKTEISMQFEPTL